MKRFTFSVPQNILFGEGVLKELPGAAGKLGGKHGFIISGPTLNRLGVVGQCEEILTQAGIAVSTFVIQKEIHRWRLWNVQQKRSRQAERILLLLLAAVPRWMWQKP